MAIKGSKDNTTHVMIKLTTRETTMCLQRPFVFVFPRKTVQKAVQRLQATHSGRYKLSHHERTEMKLIKYVVILSLSGKSRIRSKRNGVRYRSRAAENDMSMSVIRAGITIVQVWGTD